MTKTTVTKTAYSDEQALRLKTAYLSVKDKGADERKAMIEKLAIEMGKNTRSIVAKLSNMQVYVSPERVTKTGDAIQTKADMVQKIAEKFEIDELVLSSLESATKQALHAILNIKKA